MLASIFDAFVKQSPISVMMQGVMERVFRVQRIDEIFETHAKQQYTRELLFSSLVNLLSLVVCRIHPSVNAAYKAKMVPWLFHQVQPKYSQMLEAIQARAIAIPT